LGRVRGGCSRASLRRQETFLPVRRGPGISGYSPKGRRASRASLLSGHRCGWTLRVCRALAQACRFAARRSLRAALLPASRSGRRVLRNRARPRWKTSTSGQRWPTPTTTRSQRDGLSLPSISNDACTLGTVTWATGRRLTRSGSIQRSTCIEKGGITDGLKPIPAAVTTAPSTARTIFLLPLVCYSPTPGGPTHLDKSQTRVELSGEREDAGEIPPGTTQNPSLPGGEHRAAGAPARLE
jgi:hypothetical protein